MGLLNKMQMYAKTWEEIGRESFGEDDLNDIEEITF